MPKPPQLSLIGTRMSRLTGVRSIMKDIAHAIKTSSKELSDISAGNPVILPEVAAMWSEITQELIASKEFDAAVGRYGASQGYNQLWTAISKDLNSKYGTNFNESNVLITPGSQGLYFLAANALCGKDASGVRKKLLLPISPDYTGYGGISIDEDAVVAAKPKIETDDKNHSFKYLPDFKNLQIDSSVGMILFSRPTNPSGNVISEEDVKKIAAEALKFGIPVFVDSAYGPPYPNIATSDLKPVFGENILHCMSLSKTGLAGERIGIAVGAREYLEPLECFMSNACIHSSRLGQAIVTKAINSGQLGELSKKVITPYYNKKRELLTESLHKSMPKELSWYLHRGEGGMFGWLWINDEKFNDVEFYQKLKKQEVLIVPGSGFFPGIKEEWKHTHQCIRISLTAQDDHIVRGCKILGESLRA